VEHAICDLCGADAPVPYLHSFDRFSGRVFTLSKCSKCSLVYLTPRPDQAELEAHYPGSYEAYDPNLENYRGVKQLRGSETLMLQVKYVEKFQPGLGKLLDVGCATGRFLIVARSSGWEVMGLEIIDKAAQIGRDHFQLNIISSQLERTHLPENSFDVVTLWDVLEHMPSPRKAFEKIISLLRPGGYVFFSIPNLDSFDRKLFGDDWIGWDPPRHFYLFNQTTIRRLLDETGYQLLDHRCLSGGKGAFYLSLEKTMQKRRSLRRILKFYPLISLLLWPYRKVSYWMSRGPIMYYAARKR